jgi:hypothetical protein
MVQSWPIMKYLPVICLEEVRIKTKHVSYDSQPLDRDLNQGSSYYKVLHYAFVMRYSDTDKQAISQWI